MLIITSLHPLFQCLQYISPWPSLALPTWTLLSHLYNSMTIQLPWFLSKTTTVSFLGLNFTQIGHANTYFMVSLSPNLISPATATGQHWDSFKPDHKLWCSLHGHSLQPSFVCNQSIGFHPFVHSLSVVYSYHFVPHREWGPNRLLFVPCPPSLAAQLVIISCIIYAKHFCPPLVENFVFRHQ